MALIDFMDESSEMFEEGMKTAADFHKKKEGEKFLKNLDKIKQNDRIDRVLDNTWSKEDRQKILNVEKDVMRHKPKYNNKLETDSKISGAVDAKLRNDRHHKNEGAIEFI